MSPAGPVSEALTRIVREEWRTVIATLVRDLRDLDLAEDAAQEAVVEALRAWPARGVPDRPGAWLVTVARRKAIDRLRRDARQREKVAALVASEARAAAADGAGDPAAEVAGGEDAAAIGDDQLALIFACCHPALAIDAQVALALRQLCGLTTPEIAAAFLVPEATMAQRLVRAKRKIRAAAIPFAVPDASLRRERVDAVLAVVLLVFTEGYQASGGTSTIRAPLCLEAVRLARVLARLLPDDAEVLGLLALLLLTEARRSARLDEHGDLVTLDDQDRTRWNRAMIDDGLAVLARAAACRATGPYQLQAAIAAVHDRAPDAASTDWAAIATLYGMLDGLAPSPVVRLNRAVAVGIADGADRGLALLDALAAGAPASPVVTGVAFHAARGELLRRSGRTAEAAAAFADALVRARTPGERRFLERRVAELG